MISLVSIQANNNVDYDIMILLRNDFRIGLVIGLRVSVLVGYDIFIN